MYRNLRAEMVRKNISNQVIAAELGIDVSTLSVKFNRYDRLKLCEAIQIQTKFFPEYTVDYLFKGDPTTAPLQQE